MSWNPAPPPPPPQNRPSQPYGDPWATSSSSTGAWPTTSGGATPQWPTQQPQQQQWNAASSAWPSNTNTSGYAPQPSTAGAWPSSSPTASMGGGGGGWGNTSSASLPRAAPQPTTNSQWPSQWPTTANTSSAAPQWPTTSNTTSALNTSGGYWGGAANTSATMMNTSQQSAGGWPAAARPAPQQQQVANPFGGGAYPAVDPFSSYMAGGNTSYVGGNTSYQSANTSVTNPFDVTNDDAGFFSASTAKKNTTTSMPSKQSSSSAADNVPPPSATTQRLMRVASMLFERGLIIKADKLFIQDLVLRGDKKAERALEVAERDGTLQDLHAAIIHERRGGDKASGASDDDDSEDESAQAAASSFKKRPSMARKNSDDDQTETLDVSKAASKSGGVSAPHPAAGGYTGNVPPEMGIQKGQFVGTILMRISSKKMFRKWKQVFFALDMPRVVIYENRREWEMSAPPKFVIPLHECMWIAKPTLKKTYSLIDDGRRVYYSTLKENSPATVGQAAMSGMERPTAFSPALEARVVAKFGSYYPDEISAFAHSIYSVVLVHQKEIKASLARSGGGGGSSRRLGGSGFGGH